MGSKPTCEYIDCSAVSGNTQLTGSGALFPLVVLCRAAVATAVKVTIPGALPVQRQFPDSMGQAGQLHTKPFVVTAEHMEEAFVQIEIQPKKGARSDLWMSEWLPKTGVDAMMARVKVLIWCLPWYWLLHAQAG